MNDNGIQSTIKEYVRIQDEIGLHDLDMTNFQVWYFNKKLEVHTLQQDTLKPLQRKKTRINHEIDEEVEKIKTLNEYVSYVSREFVSKK